MSLVCRSVETTNDDLQPSLVAEPLVFRTLDDSNVPVVEPLTAEEELIPDLPSFDLEATLHAAREQGRREASEAARIGLEQGILAEREALMRTVQQFEEEKQRYFSEVEREVVKLSLAIAERVLHRESAMDPTFLAGAARVALEQVSASSDIVLRVSPEEADRWIETMKSAPKGMVIEADEGLPRGECVLKTSSGTVQLGLRAQLQEIERGFFELLGRRPGFEAGAC